MHLVSLVFSSLALIQSCVGQDVYGAYSNPNPRPYKKCEAQDLMKLSQCSNEVLSKLENCKANDFACECCALQSIDTKCYTLCPNNPSNNFLTILLNDCMSLNDVNACALPFKKSDWSVPSKADKVKAKNAKILVPEEVSIKSNIHEEGDEYDFKVVDMHVETTLSFVELHTASPTNWVVSKHMDNSSQNSIKSNCNRFQISYAILIVLAPLAVAYI